MLILYSCGCSSAGAVDVRADDPKLKRLEPPRLKPWEKFFLPQIAVGLGVTAQHIAGVMFANKAITVQYPEEQHVPSPNYRGVHRLNKDEEGRVKCVACMLCATACPAHCIDIVGATAPPTWPDREKYPENFVIDELRCIYCGMCEEACPVEAIELTGLYDLTGLAREEMIFDKTKLLSVFDLTKRPRADAVRQAAGRACFGDQDLAVAGVIGQDPLERDARRSPDLDRLSRRKPNTMSIGDVILATVVVVLGAAGTYCCCRTAMVAPAPRRVHRSRRDRGKFGATGFPRIAEPAGPVSAHRVFLHFQPGRDHRRSS